MVMTSCAPMHCTDCGSTATELCGRYQQVRYCSKACQKRTGTLPSHFFLSHLTRLTVLIGPATAMCVNAKSMTTSDKEYLPGKTDGFTVEHSLNDLFSTVVRVGDHKISPVVGSQDYVSSWQRMRGLPLVMAASLRTMVK